MSVTKNDVAYIANLARLRLTEDETAQYQTDLNSILGYIDLLNQVDTQHVEPLEHVSNPPVSYRKDVTTPALDHELALKNAPDADSDYFRVPKVIE